MKPHRQPLDDDTASRMLQGLVHPDDAPPGYASVVGLLASAAQLPPPAENTGIATISAMVEVIRAGAAPTPESPRRRSMLGKLFAGKALVAMATVALTATGAAAATGSLPAPVQGAVSEAVRHVGVDLPADAGKSAHRQDGDHRQSGNKDQAKEDHGQPGDDGGEDAGDNGKGAEISELTHDLKADDEPRGPTVSDFASNGKSQAGEEHGKPTGDSDDTETETAPVKASKARGEERSGRDLEPSGQGKRSAQVD